MTRYFLDTEFREHKDEGNIHRTVVDLISIAIVSSDGREYYAQSAEFLEHGKPTPWLEEHVIPYLTNEWKECDTIRNEIEPFMDVEAFGKPELWAWCGTYDHFALCQLFGGFMQVPSGWPHYIKDIQYILDERGIADEDLPQQEGTAHNALEDAKHIECLWEFLEASK